MQISVPTCVFVASTQITLGFKNSQCVLNVYSRTCGIVPCVLGGITLKFRRDAEAVSLLCEIGKIQVEGINNNGVKLPWKATSTLQNPLLYLGRKPRC